MSKLTLEQVKKIEHLKLASEKSYYNGPHDTPTLIFKDGLIAWKLLADHPTLEAMLDWIFDHGSYSIRKTWHGVSKFLAESSTGNESFFIGNQLTWTEAAYKAICIIEGIEP